MVTRNEYFITQTKLRELREQRGKLLAAYDALSQQGTQEQTEAGRLRALYTGLQQIKFASYALHPDVSNLEPLLQEAESGQASLETISFWRARLEKELSNGRLRSEVVYLFGALLEEWALQQTSAPASETNDEETRRLIAQQADAPAETAAAAETLDPLFRTFGFTGADAPALLQAALSDRLQRQVDVKELTDVLEQMIADPYRSASLHSQARGMLLDKVLLKELADALTIVLQHVDEWDWPSAGVPAQARLTPHKWRLFLDDELPGACFLEVLAKRWQEIFHELLEKRQQARLASLRRWQAGTAGEDAAGPGNVTAGLGLLGEVDIWAEGSQGPLTAKEQMSRWIEYNVPHYYCIAQARSQMRTELRMLSWQVGYGAQETISGLEKALMFINAEIQLGRAAFPERPLYVVKVDLKEFYPNLPHDLLLTILQRYGLSAAQLDFFRKYLRLPLAHNGQVARSQRGLPLGPHLSDVLGDLVLGLLEQYVQREAQVRIVRMIDDICVLTPSAEEAVKAWQAVQRFCAACGLALNLEKCGSVCIGGARPDALPVAAPDWLLLRLDQQGQWDVNWPVLETYLEQARQQVAQAPSFVARVQTYNAQVRYLVMALGLRVPLGEAHRRSVARVMQRLHQSFFGRQQGMVAALRQIIQERFLGQDSLTAIPEAWFYWPITAGGAGMTQAPLLAAGYEAYLAQAWKAVVPRGASERLAG